MKLQPCYQVYDENHLRVIAYKFSRKYDSLSKTHVYWIAKQLNIYPDAECVNGEKIVRENRTGKINKANDKFVTKGKLNENGVKAIEDFIVKEGYAVKKDYKDEQMEEKTVNVWDQVNIIAMMKQDYEKAIAERDEAKTQAQENFELLKQYESEIDELKDKLLICEIENTDLKAEKKELSKMQIDSVNFSKEIDTLQVRIGKYSQEVNLLLSDMSVLRKDYSSLQIKMNQMQDSKKKLDGVLSDLVGCSKRLMNLK